MAWTRSILDLIGNTPMIELHTFDTGPCRLLVKLESANPGGSIKDRIGRSMIEGAERAGKIKPGKMKSGSMLVEATAGNTGLGLALVAATKGYQLTLVIPDKMSQEKVLNLRALGARIVMTRSDVGWGHPQYYQDLARRIAAETPGAYFINQFNNPDNPLAHELTTGPEIWEQTDHKADAVVVGVGSGGTITGLSRYFAKVAPNLQMVLADPVGSVLADYVHTGRIGTAGSWVVEGIGEDIITPIADLSRVRAAYSISDADSLATARKLLKDEGILAGSSSGTLVAAAVQYCREQTSPKTVVTLICDTGNKYLSKIHNDNWMGDHGFGSRPKHGDLRDLISRPFDEGAVVSVEPGEPITIAYTRMRLHDVSQLPVMSDGKLVGIIDESDLLLAITRNQDAFDRLVREVMTSNLRRIGPQASMDELLSILNAGLVAVVDGHEGFEGLITRVDVLNHLRRQRDAREKIA